ncbi:YbgA family protein [Isoalcanivorax indicus]|uniref:YbgA family protein n=1 Tax=Isoalcanivorax indicus TaxID=2202653 RepID=UPI000DBA8B70|nr:DUF523 and DUF1722 domain-containing protein [Isoalcanivorax indicus]
MSTIPVGISACLTGQTVRHDGGHKHSRYCTEVLSRWFTLRPLCPEAGAGLGTPRPSMRLEQRGEAVRLISPRNDHDVTDAVMAWSASQLDALADLRGFILTAKSPSCGMSRIRVYNPEGDVVRRDASGLFAVALMQRYPLLPVEEAARLNDDALRENFMERVFLYDDWCRLRAAGLSAATLLDFHTRHKLQMLAHSQQGYRELGRLLADLKRVDLNALADEYIARVMHLMRQRVSPGAHVNVMQHVLGYFRRNTDAALREAADAQIAAYQRGEVPLVVPLTLLRLMQQQAPDAWLARQHYLAPYPDALGLRNRL